MFVDTQWMRFRQRDSNDESFNPDATVFHQKNVDSEINHGNNQFNNMHMMNNDDDSELILAELSGHNTQYGKAHFGLNENLNQRPQQQYGSQNLDTFGELSGLAKNIDYKNAATEHNNNDHPELTLAELSGHNTQHGKAHFGLNENLSQQQHQQQFQQQQFHQQQQHSSQNRGTVDELSGLAKKIADKIAAVQRIAIEHNIAANAGHQLKGELNVARSAIRLSKDNFVSFYNTTMKNLDGVDLKYMYLNPGKDTVFAQYHFNEINTSGLFASDVQYAGSGRYTVVMNDVYSNLSTGFDDGRHAAAVRPAKFQSADARLTTADGSVTRAFDPAVQKWATVLTDAVSEAVRTSATESVALQRIKNEMRGPVSTGNGKLFDLVWRAANVAIEMPDIGFFRNTEGPTGLLESMTFQRTSRNAYTVRYDMVLKNMQWTSAVTVSSAGTKTTTPSTTFVVPKMNIRVSFAMSTAAEARRQSCDNVSVDVDVQGLNFNLDDSVRSDIASTIDTNLQHSIQHSLASSIQMYLSRNVCNVNY